MTVCREASIVVKNLLPVDCTVYASAFDYALDILKGLEFEVFGGQGLSRSKEWRTTGRERYTASTSERLPPNMLVGRLAQGAFFGTSVPAIGTDTTKLG